MDNPQVFIDGKPSGILAWADLAEFGPRSSDDVFYPEEAAWIKKLIGDNLHEEN